VRKNVQEKVWKASTQIQEMDLGGTEEKEEGSVMNITTPLDTSVCADDDDDDEF
jgi:hypothetical protein